MQQKGSSPRSGSLQTLVNRVRHGPDLLRAAQGRDRARLAAYLMQNLMNQVFGLPVSSREVNLVLYPGIRVSVHTFSSQLGAYLDVFRKEVYGQLLGFHGEPGQVIVDAGAHVGFYALWQASRVGPSGCVYAFEPNPPIYDLLLKNVQQNGLDWVRCFPKALAAREGRVTLGALPRGSSSARVLHSHGSEDVPVVEVSSATLDTFVEAYGLERIDILKMDTEGAELDIVHGGVRRALAITERIVMESHPLDRSDPRAGKTRDSVRDFLRPFGFRHVMDHCGRKIVYFERGS